jgi:hypothetical protein
MPKNSREYHKLYMRQYRAERQCRGRDHVPTVEAPVNEVNYPAPSTPDEILGAKQSLLALHRLRTIGVKLL